MITFKRNAVFINRVNTGMTYNIVNWVDGACITNKSSSEYIISMDLMRPAQMCREEAEEILNRVYKQGLSSWEIVSCFEYIKEMSLREEVNMSEEMYIIANNELNKFVMRDEAEDRYTVTDNREQAELFNYKDAESVFINNIGLTRINKIGWRIEKVKQHDTLDDLEFEPAPAIQETAIEDGLYSFFDSIDDEDFDNFCSEDNIPEDVYFNSGINYKDYDVFKTLSMFFIEDFMRNCFNHMERYMSELSEDISLCRSRIEHIRDRLDFEDGDEKLKEQYVRSLDEFEERISKDRFKIRMMNTLLNADHEDIICGTVRDVMDSLAFEMNMDY